MKSWRFVLVTMAVLTAALLTGPARSKPAPAVLYPATITTERATLAGGCFWSLQEILRQIPGVLQTRVGYTGGTNSNPTYELVAGGKTGHTEAVEVVFDPAKVSYEQLLADFLAARNPVKQSTGTPHRSAIFYHDKSQRLAAERVKAQVNQSGKWSVPVVAELAPATTFYPAEEYHQDYYRKTAAQRTCSLE